MLKTIQWLPIALRVKSPVLKRLYLFLLFSRLETAQLIWFLEHTLFPALPIQLLVFCYKHSFLILLDLLVPCYVTLYFSFIILCATAIVCVVTYLMYVFPVCYNFEGGMCIFLHLRISIILHKPCDTVGTE